MPGGRPTKYDPAMCEVVIACGDEGKTIAEMARAINISKDTLNEWRKSNPEFSAAVKEGLSRAQAWWEEKGRMATFGAIDGFNATSFIFNMKNRFRDDWRDKHEQELSGPNGSALTVNVVKFANDADDTE